MRLFWLFQVLVRLVVWWLVVLVAAVAGSL